MIEFIEKKQWTHDDPLYGRTYAPIYMVKDEIEHFVVNRIVREPDKAYGKYHVEQSDKEVEAYKAFLTQNKGTYFKLHGFYDDPLEMMTEIERRKHTFTTPNDLFVDCRGSDAYGAGFTDFHGNRNEVSASFHYRIYDEEFLEKIQKAVKQLLVGDN